MSDKIVKSYRAKANIITPELTIYKDHVISEADFKEVPKHFKFKFEEVVSIISPGVKSKKDTTITGYKCKANVFTAGDDPDYLKDQVLSVEEFKKLSDYLKKKFEPVEVPVFSKENVNVEESEETESEQEQEQETEQEQESQGESEPEQEQPQGEPITTKSGGQKSARSK